MRCCHGNGLKPKIDNQNISLILTVPILVNLYREISTEKLTNFSNSRSIGMVFVNTPGSHLKRNVTSELVVVVVIVVISKECKQKNAVTTVIGN